MPASQKDAQIRFSIVFPVTGSHAWDLTEGWVNALNRLGVLNRVFRSKAQWGAADLEEDDGLLDFLASDPTDYLLLLGLDWHSQPLHYGIVGELLRKRRSRNISLIWEDYASAHAESSGLKARMLEAWDRSSTIPFVTFTNHHANIGELKERLEGGAIEYLPFGVDEERFMRCEKPFDEKKPAIYFSGKVTDWANQADGGPYARRRKFIETLRETISYLDVQTGKLSEKEYVEGLSANRICINLPSFSSSPTLRNYEALAAGGALITWRPPAGHPNDLSAYPNIFWYDWHDPESAVQQARRVMEMPDKELEQLCREGRDMAWRECSLLQRATSVRNYVQERPYPTRRTEEKKTPVVVVDGVFFQVAHNGIAYVWDSIIRKMISRIGRENIILINRDGTLFKHYGCREIHTGRFDWDIEPDAARDEIDLLLRNNSVGECIFASSYYTVSKFARNVQIIHDMIPEIMEGDESVWKHKDFSIANSNTILCVSGSTYWDLMACHPAAWPHTRIALNGMPLAHIEASKSSPLTHESRARLARATDSSVFKVLYIGGRVGWKGYKNGITLLRAFRSFCGRISSEYPARLVFISGNTWPEQQITRELEGLDVEFVYADDAELAYLREHADCFVYPSFLEGFGLPVLEALYAGLPVIASRVPPIIEAGRDFRVLFFNPSSPEQLADHLAKVHAEQKSSPCHEHLGEIASMKDLIAEMSHQRWEYFVDLILGADDASETIASLPYHGSLTSFLSTAKTNFRVKQIRSRQMIEAVWK